MINPKHRKAFILTHLGLGDIILCNGLIRYIYSFYDKTSLVIKRHYEPTVRELYGDLKTLSLHLVNTDRDISPAFGYSKEQFNTIVSGYDVYLCGSHLGRSRDLSLFPLNFYDDLSIPRNILWNNSVVYATRTSTELYELVKHTPYIFIHNSTSMGGLFDVNVALKHFGIDKDTTLVINPLKNVYDISDSYYELAQQCTNQPSILSFTSLIENSTMNILTDSSIFCLSTLLRIKHTHNYVVTRGITFKQLFDRASYSMDEPVDIRNTFTEISFKQ
jgi:hypothetical protein